MSKKLDKIGRLANPESFLQVDTVQGYKYIDRAGELVNMYSGTAAPKFKMAMNQLVMEKPVDKIDELKISPTDVWMKFLEPDSIEQSSQIFEKEVSRILRILEVTQMSRLGWRNYFVLEFSSPIESKAFFNKLVSVDLSDCSLSNVRLDLKTVDGITGNLFLQEVVKDDANKTAGVMFDLDLYSREVVLTTEIGRTLKKFREYIVDPKGFLGIVNQHLS